jgi:hypothetical protein
MQYLERAADACDAARAFGTGVGHHSPKQKETHAMTASYLVNETRSGVMIARNSEHLVAVWAQCYRIDRSLQPDERAVRLRVRIHRGKCGCPILLTKRGHRSSFLTGRTLRRFEEEIGLQVKPVELRDLDSKATGQFGKSWVELTADERLEILEWIAEG